MTLFLEATIDSLTQNGVSGLTKKHLGLRYDEGDSEISVGKSTLFQSKNFYEAVFFANSSYGATDYIASADTGTNAPQGTYTLVLRFYNVSTYLGNEDFAIGQMQYSKIEQILKSIVHNCDAKFYSDDPSWFYQGAWEGLDKNKMSIYKFPGPKGSGVWHARHGASGGLSNDTIHLTKHLAQVVEQIDAYIPKLAQTLEVK